MSSDICAGCGHVNAVGARFCALCGSSLAGSCSSCGAELEASARFCTNCGTAVVRDATAGEDGALKVVSVVFSDVVGSTALQEALETESVRRVMARFYEAMREVVERHGGSVQKFIGDAVVAVFGVPSVSEDDALRAARCAAAMTAVLEELNDELERAWGVRLQIRTGVNTGELAISHEGIFVGDTMNTAARLEQAADAGQVLLGEATWRLVRHMVEVEEVTPLELKGKAAPVRVWRLVSTEPRSAAATEAPLVGRADELTRLGAVLQEAIDTRACRLVSIIGSPGLGKSRLAAELAVQVHGRASIVHGHCEPSGEGNTFLPVAEVVREVAGIGEAEAPDVVREKLRAMNPDDPDRDRLVEAIAGVLAVAPPASAQETFWALRRGLEVLARGQPLVMVLDDLHWAQPMLLDLIEHLVEWIQDAPVLLVVLARPELRELREALTVPGRRASDVIELEALEPGESRALVDGLLDDADLPEDLLARILETTDGNPLFLGELVRMLVDERALVKTGDGWEVAGGADTIDVPPTIQALLAARIERLRADERAVVERAAVIGKQFYRGAVAELLAPPARTAIDGHLEALRRKEMVEPEGIYWIDEPVYRFHHVLLRDAAYRLLLKEARAVLHERFADWLEAKAGELVGEYEEVIGFHLERSHSYLRELGPLDDAGRALGARAAERLLSAGRRALAREDLAAAENLLSRSLECGAGDSPEALWDLAEAVLTAGNVSTAGGVVERYRTAVRGDAAGQARATVMAGALANLTGDDDPAATAEAVRTSAAQLANLGDRAGEAKAWAVAAQAYARLGRVGEVETALDSALPAARAAEDRRRTTAVLAAAPRAALWGPSSVVRSSGRCLDVVRILRMTPGNRHVEAVALRCQAVLEAMRGRTEAAREILAGARATLEELGLTLELHETQVYAGMVELLSGDPAAAAAQFRAALSGFQSLGADAAAAHVAAQLARALAASGDAAAEALAQAGFAGEHGGEDLRTAIIAAGARAEALAQSGEIEEAVASARNAVALAEPTDALADKADASMSLARVLLAAADREGADEAARAALAYYDAKGHTVGIERAQRLVGSAPTQLRPAVAVAPAGPATLGDRPPERFYAWFTERYARGDIDALVERCAPEFTLVDHRATVSQETVRGTEGFRRTLESVLVMPDARIEIREVLACDERVIALRYVLRGRAGKIEGEVEVAVGEVSVIEDGRLRSVEMYDYDDDAAMLARVAELGGQRSVVLGDSPPERVLAEYANSWGEVGLDQRMELFDDDMVLRDLRSLSLCGEIRGRDAYAEHERSTLGGVRDARCTVQEVLACTDDVIAARLNFTGVVRAQHGDPFSLECGCVTVIRNGRCLIVDLYDSDDRAAMLARFAALTSKPAALGDRPPERVAAEDIRRYNAHHVGWFVELYAENFVAVDHRANGWGRVEGHDGLGAQMAASFAISTDIRMDIDEVLACDDRVLATRVAYRGHAGDGGGEFELEVGYVTIYEDGRAIGTDVYEPEDRDAILTRFAELGGHVEGHRDRPAERVNAEEVRRYNAHDVEGYAELYAEDFVLVDHRPNGWGTIDGRDELRAQMEMVSAISADVRMERDELIAADDRVLALIVGYRGHANEGGGEFELVVGYVSVYEHGQVISTDMYESDERQAMVARYVELGGGLSALGDSPPARACAEHSRRLAARDLDAILEQYREDYVMRDHRATVSVDVPMADARASFEGIFSVTETVRLETDEVLACDDRVIARRLAYRGTAAGGGETEVRAGFVSVVENGLFVSTDVYDYDDDAMLVRFAELTAKPEPPPGGSPEPWVAKFMASYNCHDPDGFASLLSEDYVMVDHRANGWGTVEGREAMRENHAASFRTSPDIRMEIDSVLAADDRVGAACFTYSGHMADGGGEFEYAIGYVTLVEGGRALSTDAYEPEDRQAMIARYVELGGGLSALGDSFAEKWFAEFARRFARRDIEQLLELVSEDYVVIDHRIVGWEPMRGRDGFAALTTSAWAAAEIRIEVDEVLASSDRAIAIRMKWTGHSQDGGGEFVVEAGQVGVLDDQNRVVLVEQFETEDRAGMLARFAELSPRRD